MMMNTWRTLMLCALWLCASCADSDDSGAVAGDVQSSAPDTLSDVASATEDAGTTMDVTAAPEVALPAETVMTVQLINAGTGGPYTGVFVSAGDQQAMTDASGQSSVMVAAGAYHVVLETSDARAHHLYGVAGETNFKQISYMSPDSVTLGVFGSLGIQDDPARGTLVVGLDLPSLAPAVGASASIDSASDPAFIFAGFSPQAGSTIPAGGQSFVTFPNVDPGPTQISALFPNGACLPFVAEDGDPQVVVHAGEVSVVAFICD
jgi:hypothetical protein